MMGGTWFGVQSTQATQQLYSFAGGVRGGGYLQVGASPSNTKEGTVTAGTSWDYCHYKFIAHANGTMEQYFEGDLKKTTTDCDWLDTECYILLGGWITTYQSGTAYVKNLKIKHYSEV